jgi:tetratricopeptide (TPR) repeat protein
MENNGIVTATLADIYLEQGHLEKAVEIYEKLVRKEPDNTFYKQRLSSLKKDLKEKQKGPAFKRLLKKKLW